MQKQFIRRFSGFCCLFIGTCVFAASTASTQEYGSRAGQQRLERLERDLQILQRQFYRERGGQPPQQGMVPPAGVSSAKTEAQLSAIEEKWRQLVGRIETLEHRIQQLSERLDRFQKDVDFRLQSGSGSVTAPSPAPEPTSPPVRSIPPSPRQPETPTSGYLRMPASPAESQTPDSSVPQVAVPTQKTPHDTYNHAFKLLNQTRYNEARQVFNEFISTYPKDPLVGNAYYWIGETYYVERDFVTAADHFRQGYETMPKGPKAPDNLLKLAMSLDASGMRDEACVVLGQVHKKYGDAGPGIVQKTQLERSRLGCK